MNSKRITRTCLALVFAAMLVNAGFAGVLVYDQDFTTGFANSGNVPDGDPSGWQNSQVVSGLDSAAGITAVRVVLGISGGSNGDLYGWIRHETTGGTGFTALLNRVGTPGNGGFGYGNPGFAITLSSSGISDLHNYQDHSPSYNGSGQLIGTWQPDGPGFSSFNTLDPNGTWTLFLADLSSGSQSRIDTWGLEIEAVPEPVNVALAIFGMAVALTTLCARRAIRTEGREERPSSAFAS